MLKRNLSVDVGLGVSFFGVDGLLVEWVNIKLCKLSFSVEFFKEIFNLGDVGNGNNELKKVVLRKLWSYFVGDIFDDRLKDEVMVELKRIL